MAFVAYPKRTFNATKFRITENQRSSDFTGPDRRKPAGRPFRTGYCFPSIFRVHAARILSPAGQWRRQEGDNTITVCNRTILSLQSGMHGVLRKIVHPVDAYFYLIILNLTLTDFHLQVKHTRSDEVLRITI
jgi:hypothetical protein